MNDKLREERLNRVLDKVKAKGVVGLAAIFSRSDMEVLVRELDRKTEVNMLLCRDLDEAQRVAERLQEKVEQQEKYLEGVRKW